MRTLQSHLTCSPHPHPHQPAFKKTPATLTKLCVVPSPCTPLVSLIDIVLSSGWARRCNSRTHRLAGSQSASHIPCILVFGFTFGPSFTMASTPEWRPDCLMLSAFALVHPLFSLRG